MEHEREPIADTAAEYFGGMIETYDSLIQRCVPRYAEMTSQLLDYVPAVPGRVLELGCGTGNLTLRLAERFPEAELVFVDASREMLGLTAHRLAHQCGRANRKTHGVLCEFEEITPSVEGPFDLVMSCVSLHHVVDKAHLYHSIAALMNPGGSLVFADQILGGSEFNDDANTRRWLEFCRRPENCSERELQSLIDHAAAHDHYTPVAEHFALLARAGFVDMDCVWRHRVWGILTANRR
jgi:tRNA (cmo5U34)-methyltransferase